MGAQTDEPPAPGGQQQEVGWERAKVAVSLAIYWVAVSAVPLVNKAAMTMTTDNVRKFPYPLAQTFLQLSMVSFLLGVGNIVRYFCFGGKRRGDSWVFGPHIGFKFRQVLWPGTVFGLKYGVTNWGLQLLPTGKHLLLQATDMVWTVILARILLKEKQGPLECFAALLVTAGTMCVGLQTGSTLKAPLLAMTVNLLSPLLLGLVLVGLKRATTELKRADNPLGGRVCPTELTSLKLALSACVAFILAMCIENGAVHLGSSDASIEQRPPWWQALADLPTGSFLIIYAGSMCDLVFQLNLTWLTSMTSAVTVGLAGSVKVVPQWLSSAVVDGKVDVSPLGLTGMALVLAASVIYTVARIRAEKADREHASLLDERGDVETARWNQGTQWQAA